MVDNLVQQAAQTAPAIGAGSLGSLIIHGIINALFTPWKKSDEATKEELRAHVASEIKSAATMSDINLAKAELKAEIALRYMTKDEIRPMMDKLDHISNRIDALYERQGK